MEGRCSMRAQVTTRLILVSSFAIWCGHGQVALGADERSAAASATNAAGGEPRDGAAARAKGLPPGEAPHPSEGTPYQVGDLGRRIVEFSERTEVAGFSGALLAAKGGKVVAAVGVGAADLEGKV